MSRLSTLPADIDVIPVRDGAAGSGAEPGAGVSAGEATPPMGPPRMGLRRAIAHDVAHGVPEAVSSLMRTVIVALFVVTFLAQPMVIPSESMEHTLLVGDFLLMNRSALAPAGIWRRILPYSGVERGEIVTFHSPLNAREYLVKRVIGLPGDRLRMDGTRVLINGQALDEPYAVFEPIADNVYLDQFPTKVYSDPRVEPGWWKQLQQLTKDGELVIPAGEYFMLGDNRNNSLDSRYWGFVSRNEIIARPLVIYFSLMRPSRTDMQQASDDRLGHESDVSGRFKGFARWRRIFHVVH
jgi:signal peptidase I